MEAFGRCHGEINSLAYSTMTSKSSGDNCKIVFRMKDLKTTKVAREGQEPKGPKTSPSEGAAALIEKVSEVADKKPAKKTSRKKPKKSSDNTKAPKKRTSKSQAVTEGSHD